MSTTLGGEATTRILVVCTANQCRSPLGYGSLARQIAMRRINALVASAGTRATPNVSATSGTVDAARRIGIDLSAHRSTAVDAATVARADLIITMERQHIQQIVLVSPGAFARTFTLKELVRRGTAVGPRDEHESVADWIARVHAGRRPTDVLGASPDDDVDDPTGSAIADHHGTAEMIDRLMDELVDLLWPATAS